MSILLEWASWQQEQRITLGSAWFPSKDTGWKRKVNHGDLACQHLTLQVSLRGAVSLNPCPDGAAPRSGTPVHCRISKPNSSQQTSSWRLAWVGIETWWSALHTSQCEKTWRKKKITSNDILSPALKKYAEPGSTEKTNIFLPLYFFSELFLSLNLVQWWHLVWEPPGSMCADQRADPGYASAKVCYFNNRNQTLCLKRDVSSKFWRGQLIFVSLKNTSACHEANEKQSFFFSWKQSFHSCWLDEMYLPIFWSYLLVCFQR